MIKWVLIILFISVSVFAQTENTGQGIELPDFVITGVQNVSVPIIKKKKSNLLPVLTSRFYSSTSIPEKLELRDVDPPKLSFQQRIFQNQYYNGRLLLGAGGFTIPTGSVEYNVNSKRVLLHGKAWGYNEREFVDNAGVNNYGGNVGADFFISEKSSFLPGLNIDFDITFNKSSYKFFGSDTPTFKRNTDAWEIELSAENYIADRFKYGLNFSSQLLNLKENDFQENIIGGNAFVEFPVTIFDIRVDSKINKQNLVNTNYTNNGLTAYSNTAQIFYRYNRALKIGGGVRYDSKQGNSLFTPVASVNFKVNEHFHLVGEYSPNAELIGLNQLLGINRYYDLTNAGSVFLKEKNKFKIAGKFEYFQYYEIGGGLQYSKFSNYPYFEEGTQNGYFELSQTNAKNFSLFVDFLFHTGPMGQFYSKLTYSKIEDDNGNTLPYNPEFKGEAVYSYEFIKDLTFSSTVKLASQAYEDIANTRKLPFYMNLDVGLDYNLSKTFILTVDLLNILNKNNYILEGYKQKPLDVIAGVDIRF